MSITRGRCEHEPDMDDRLRALMARLLDLPTRVERSADDRVVAGVCGGIGAAVGVDPTVLRLAFAVLTVANGSGVVLYLLALVTLPQEPVPTVEAGAAKRPTAERAAGVALITFGILLLFAQLGLLLPAEIVWATALAALGFALVWTRTDAVDRTRWLILRSVGGGLLVVAGLAALFAAGGVLSSVGQLGLAVVATSVGVGLLLGPWIARLARDLARERRERIRSEERSEMAAHLHDSVLQTLALMQRTDDPKRIVTLARQQERELRAWLYGADTGPNGQRFAAALEEAASRVEADFDLPVEVVTVGDTALDDTTRAVVAAAGEAMVNAAKHSGAAEVSVYAEVADGRVDVWVADQGKGFDLGSVPPDRRGLQDSIRGRMARAGGGAEIDARPGEGTEVHVWAPLAGEEGESR